MSRDVVGGARGGPGRVLVLLLMLAALYIAVIAWIVAREQDRGRPGAAPPASSSSSRSGQG